MLAALPKRPGGGKAGREDGIAKDDDEERGTLVGSRGIEEAD